MYPKNNASPEPLAIGAVIQISDGAVQTSGVTVRIKPNGVAEGDGAGTTAYSTDGVVLYTPTQAETNYTSFILIAKKTGCIPAYLTVVTSASATPGTVEHAGTIKTLDALDTAQNSQHSATQTAIADVPTVSEFNARTLAAADYFDPAVDAVANVTLVGTVTTLTNLPAITTNWLTAAGLATDAVTEIQSGLATAANLATVAGYLDTEIAAILVDTGELQADWADGGRLDLIVDAILNDTEDIQTRLPAALTADGNIKADTLRVGGTLQTAGDIPALVGVVDSVVDSMLTKIVATTGTVDNALADATTLSFKTNLTDADDTWNDQLLVITSGALAGQCRPILDYDQTNGVFTFEEPFTDAPSNGVTFDILVAHVHPASQIQSGLASQTSVNDIPTVAEFEARTIPSADYFDPAADAVANVTLVATTTNLTNLPTIPANWLTAAGLATDAVAEIQSGLATAANLATVAGYLDTEIAAILADTGELQADWADGGRLDLILDARATQASLLALAGKVTLEGLVIGGTGNDTTHLQIVMQYPADSVNGHQILFYDNSTGLSYTNWIVDWAGSPTYLATLGEALPVTPQDDTDFVYVLTSKRHYSLPDVTPNTNGGLPTVDASLRVSADVTAVSGDSTTADNIETAWSASPVLSVNVAYVNANINSSVYLETLLDGFNSNSGLPVNSFTTNGKSELQTEANDALVANHLDHIFAETYDPASKPGAADALFNELIGSDAGVSQFTANALELAPTGGAAPSAADIRAEIDLNSTQLAAIVADTNELQTNQGNWLTATGFSTLDAAGIRSAIGLSVANMDAQLADIPTVSEFNARTLLAADYFDPASDAVANVTLVATTTTLTNLPAITTNWLTAAGLASDAVSEIQSGLATAANLATVAGYLDTEISAILADTNELQTNQGNWLTADVSGLSTHSAADVRTELATELSRIDVATSTRQATVANLANVVTMAAQFSTMIVVDGAVYDFTSAALAAGPGGDATVAKQNEIIADIAAMQEAVDLIAGAAGPGGIAWEVTVNDSEGDPIGDVGCWVSTDSAGTNVIAGTLYTTEFGIVTFMLNAGTYYLWRNSTSHDFTNPTVMTVA